MNYLAKQNPQKLRDKADKLCKTILKNMDILQELLNNINAILQIEEADNERDKKNGNSLNLFSSLNLKTSELIHSRMIAELLNPNSSHGKGSIFLKKFIELHDFEFTFDVESASVSTEFDIGPISKNSCKLAKTS